MAYHISGRTEQNRILHYYKTAVIDKQFSHGTSETQLGVGSIRCRVLLLADVIDMKPHSIVY